MEFELAALPALELPALTALVLCRGPAVRARLPAGDASSGWLLALSAGGPLLARGHRQPPIGAFGFAPQKIWVPSIPIKWTKIMFKTIDLAVAVPTPTGPPLAL